MFDQIKPTCAMYVLHSQQRQPLGDQDLMKCLNFFNDLQRFISLGTRSHILGAKYLFD